MTGAALSNILLAFALLASFLLLGTLLRAKVGLFQKLFIPASVIGGAVGLLISPAVWGEASLVSYPADWLKLYALLPGVLIIPVVASVPLGIKFAKSKAEKSGTATKDVLNMFWLQFAAFGLQLLVGATVGYLFILGGSSLEIFPSFGVELPLGFIGGHGTAGVVGRTLQDMGMGYWELSQGVTVTFATFGLLGGIIAGIALVRWAAARGHLSVMDKATALPKELLTGLQPDPEKQKPAGYETTLSSSVDVLGFNLALILAGSGLAMVSRSFVRSLDVPLVGAVPVWAYAIVIMWIIWWGMNKIGVQWLVDQGVKSKIASCFTDIAIVAALVSMPIQGVLTYIFPILIGTIVGFISSVALVMIGSHRLFKTYWFERAMLILGSVTGVFLTGLLLLKICDPDFKTDALRDGSLAYSLSTFSGFILLPIYFGLAIEYGILALVAFGAACIAISIIAMLASKFIWPDAEPIAEPAE